MTLSKKVYVFNRQQLINEFFFQLVKNHIIREISITVVVCQCITIHYKMLLKIQQQLVKMRTILSSIQKRFLRSRVSEFYSDII